MITQKHSSGSKVPVRVVVPIYRSTLPPDQIAALENNMARLASRPVTFVAPEGVDIGSLTSRWPHAQVLRVSDRWLGTANGIAGYNAMMLSADFYALFTDCEYIFICHTDAWMFADDLDRWCAAGYDVVAPPWVARPRYNCFPLKQINFLINSWSTKLRRPAIYGRIGNGGLSLRRVDAFKKACLDYEATARTFLSHPGSSVYNEDVFWALIPKEFRYPTQSQALEFGFDYRPDLCFALNGNRLPMGCHGFNKRRHRAFWEQFISPLSTSAIKKQ